ncbi:hypothetical protein [Spirosoma radiotolerans]|uniref:hypothetical protein n=1 Tax=Spirosoma radiotolerans TaxID=1379870 RepID=UPI0006964F76|nr:hypothetical protein [Spirosoma radiotolerans]
MSVKTFREYKKPPTTFKENVKEQVLLLLALVPSAIIIYEHNYIINTEHSDFSQHVQLVRTEDYF